MISITLVTEKHRLMQPTFVKQPHGGVQKMGYIILVGDGVNPRFRYRKLSFGLVKLRPIQKSCISGTLFLLFFRFRLGHPVHATCVTQVCVICYHFLFICFSVHVMLFYLFFVS